MRLSIMIFFMTITVLIPLPVSAEDNATSSPAPPAAEGRKVRAGKTVYDFDEVDILGALKRPEGQSIVEQPEFHFQRLLDLNESFLPNVIRSADEF